ncbi:unnamed protein product [Penicillium salamii]|nr:unnamed protein product [Penicillium salamii]
MTWIVPDKWQLRHTMYQQRGDPRLFYPHWKQWQVASTASSLNGHNRRPT